MYLEEPGSAWRVRVDRTKYYQFPLGAPRNVPKTQGEGNATKPRSQKEGGHGARRLPWPCDQHDAKH